MGKCSETICTTFFIDWIEMQKPRLTDAIGQA